MAQNTWSRATSADAYKIHLFRLTNDGTSIDPNFDKVIHQSRGSEANKLYKIGGIYYHYFSEVRPEGRVAMMERAPSFDGPWEIRQLNHVNKTIDREPNQGGLIELADGRWFFLTHHEATGDWEGRPISLPAGQSGRRLARHQGAPSADGIGQMVWRGAKPINAKMETPASTKDDFDQPQLDPRWEWNYQPRADMWSLTEKPGFCTARVSAKKAERFAVGGQYALTTRMMRRPTNQCIARLEISGMVDGQRAGLCHFAKSPAFIGVSQDAGMRTLVFNRQGTAVAGPAISSSILFLRCSWDFDGNVQFAYSADGDSFSDFGDKHRLAWGSYRGERIGVFCFNNKIAAGYVDVDWVQTW